MKIQKNEGITLIALVITIIVLLILAGVSIAMLTGDNGILTQANKSKEETTLAEQEEKRKLKEQEAYMEEYNFVDTEVTSTEMNEEGTPIWECIGSEITAYHGNETEIYVPTKIDGVEMHFLGENVFQGNTTIKKIVSSVPTLNGSNFIGCTNLETVILKEGTQVIGNYTFVNCTKLEYIALPSTITTIGTNAFTSSGMRNMFIPKAVKILGEGIFAGCKNKITVHCEIEESDKPSGWAANWSANALGGIEIDWGYTK